jgi:hypothetical protein
MKVIRRTPKEVRKLWLKNLTNGKYKWKPGSFTNVDRTCYCSLGVLSDMMYKDGNIKADPQKEDYKLVCAALEYIGLSKEHVDLIWRKNDRSDSNFATNTKGYQPVVKFLKQKFIELKLSC